MGVFTITIVSNGQPIDVSFTLTEVDIQREVNRIPYARLSFVDGNPGQQVFELSNSPHFIPGQELEIRGRYESDAGTEATLFKGMIVKHSVEADVDGSHLSVELKDPVFKMTTVRKTRVFREQTEEAVFRELIESNDLQVEKMATSDMNHQELVQYYCSDWDFLLARSDLYGWWVHTREGAVTVVNPVEIRTDDPAHRFSFGISEIYNLHLEVDAESQVDQVESIGWDLVNQAATAPARGAALKMKVGNLNAADLAAAMNAGALQLQSMVPLQPEELQVWSDSKVSRTRLAMVRGSFTVPGVPTIQPLEVMEIEGVSDRFNGKAVISGIRHRISVNGWLTDVQFGLRPDRFVDQFRPEENPAAGLLPSIQGLQIGVVGAFETDPDEQFRVRVKLPGLGPEAGPVWARLASPDAGGERGFFFHPERGDEVIVGFLNDDPRHAVILGSLYSQALPPPVDSGQINESNPEKGIFSREGLQLKMDDENQVLEIRSGEDQSITLDQQNEQIEIQDLHGNKLTLDKNGITLKSVKNIVIEAAANVEIKGKKVDVK